MVLVLFHEPLLRGLAGVLVKNDPVEAADAVVFMAASGPIQTLPFDELARLQHEGLASRILLIESRSSRIVKAGVVPTVESVLRRELGARGVPEDALETVAGDFENSLWRQARFLRDWLRDHPGTRVTLLCDEADGRRAAWVLGKVLAPEEAGRVHWRALPDERFTTANWWHTRQGICWLGAAYVVLIHTLVQGEAAEDKRWDPDEYEKGLRAGKDR